jgi:acyl-CoA-binding protein
MSLMLQVTFEEAVELVKKLKQSPDNDELLELYALFKQATVG